MPRKGRSNEEIVHALRQVESGEKVTEVCRRLGVDPLNLGADIARVSAGRDSRPGAR